MTQHQRAPSLCNTEAVSDAPGRGILPQFSGHSAALPQLYELDAQPVEQFSPLVQRQMLHGVQCTFVKWIAKKGAIFRLHNHHNEQITWIVEGSCDVYSQGKKFAMKAGMILIIPPNVPHEFICTEDMIDIDFFAPQRQDWINGVAPAAAGPP